jgi:FtsH-binding integral membrane protein
MGKTAIGFGVALIVIGVVGYAAGGASSFTGLIPAFFGIALAGLGAWANSGGKAEKNAMHIASVVALLGTLAPLSRIVPGLTSGGELGLAFWSNALMFVVCGVFLVLCIRSFIENRKARSAMAK